MRAPRTSSRSPEWLERQRDVRDSVLSQKKLRRAVKFFQWAVDKAGATGVFYWSNAAIAREFHVSVRTVQTWIRLLEEADVIACRHLDYGADIPGTDGGAVFNEQGIRVVFIQAVWGGCAKPGAKIRRPRNGGRKTNPIKRSRGGDPPTKHNHSLDHGGGDQNDTRKRGVANKRVGTDKKKEGNNSNPRCPVGLPVHPAVTDWEDIERPNKPSDPRQMALFGTQGEIN